MKSLLPALILSLLLAACTETDDFHPDSLGGGSADGFTQAAIVLGTLQYGDQIAVDHRPGFIDDLPFNADDADSGEACSVEPETWRCSFSARFSTPVSQVCRNGTWLNFHLNPQDCGACEAGNTDGCRQNPDAVNAGYEVQGHAGSTLVSNLTAEEPAVLIAYGPKRNDSWADAQPIAFVHADDAELGVSIDEEGTYLLLVRREDSAELPSRYQLAVDCDGAACGNGTTYDVAFTFKSRPAEIKAEPSKDAALLGELAWDTTGVRSTGRQVGEGSTLWVELADGGWVNRHNLVESVSLESTCESLGHPGHPESQALSALESAIATQNFDLLENFVSPQHGIGFAFSGNAGAGVVYDRFSIQKAFASDRVHNWGIDANGDKIEGTFSEVILPKLDSIQPQGGIFCGAGETGEQWAAVYQNLNHITYSTPEDEWMVGFEYVSGEPFVTVLTYIKR